MKKGAFIEAVNRNSEMIKEDRADAIYEEAHMLYKRAIEDLECSVKKVHLYQAGALDMSSGDHNSIISARHFNAEKYVKKDITKIIELKNLEFSLEALKERVEFLFGKEKV